MRCTFGRCLRVSSTPMYTTHSIPSRAHTVAVATPCWPAPVSAMIRRLPILLASSAWPRALLSLCEPVWLRSSRFRYTARPTRSESLLARYSGVGRPPKSRSSPRARPSSPHPRAPSRHACLELRQRRHQRLGDVLPAVGPEAVLERRTLAPPALTPTAWPTRRRRSTAPDARDGVEERPQLVRVLASRRGLGSARRVDRVGRASGDRLGHVLRASSHR